MSSEYHKQIAERIRIAREALGLNQEQFTQQFGCSDRQTISAIETGLRPTTAQELLRIAKILQKPLEFFTDPFLVTDKHAFSYRATPNSVDIDSFEKVAHNLISADRRFRKRLGHPDVPFGNQLKGITKQTPVWVAADAGDNTGKSLKLSNPPALNLRDAVEAQLRINIFFVDAPASISGAACHLPDSDYLLINRREPSFRRNFNIGHELFHILTWMEMPPDRIDEVLQEKNRSKVEKLADNFSSGLLLPKEQISDVWHKKAPNQDIHSWIINLAKEYKVSGEAIYWRLINLRLLPKTENIDKNKLSRFDEEARDGVPNLYNAEFVGRLHAVLHHGFISVRKAADLLNCEPYELQAIVEAYGFESTF